MKTNTYVSQRKQEVVARFSQEKINTIFRRDAIENADITELHEFVIVNIQTEKDRKGDLSFIVEADIVNPMIN